MKLLFPKLFVIAVDRDATIAEYLHRSNDENHWCSRFSWELQDWDHESVGNFYKQTLSKNQNFNAKSYHWALQGDSEADFPWCDIWKAKVSTKVAFPLGQRHKVKF